jgi:short-subunit dehydrogenase
MPQTPYLTALITGASAGMGAEFARQLAASGTDLILVARRLDRLTELARELQGKHAVKVEVLRADLATSEGIEHVERRIAEDATFDLLVNNAGFGGGPGSFSEREAGHHLNMVQVHVAATVRLCRAALPGMIARGRGGIINLASIAAFSPFSGPMYSGTKAFLVMFSENLQGELKERGVFVQALCPGMTHTEFHEVANIDKAIVPKFFWMTAEEVVRISLHRLGRAAICVPGWKNKVIAFLMRCPLTAGGVRALGRSKAVRKKADRGN